MNQFEQLTNGLEKRLKDKLEEQMLEKIVNLKKENEYITRKFQNFKNELSVLCKSEVVEKGNTIVKFVKEKCD